MKKILTATAALGLLAVSGTSITAFANESTSVGSKTDVTLTAGSGEDVDPIVPDDTHDDDPSTGDTGAL